MSTLKRTMSGIATPRTPANKRISTTDDNPRSLKRARLTDSTLPSSQTSSVFSSPLSSLPSSMKSRSSLSSSPKLSPKNDTACSTIPEHALLLSIPSLVMHPPNHQLYPKSLYISLLAARKCVELPDLEPDAEGQAWTNLAEVGMLVVEAGLAGFGASGTSEGSEGVEWARGVEAEVEKAASKALMIAQKHPTLRSKRTRIVLLSAKLASWQQNHKFALSLIRRHITSFLSSDSTYLIYTAHLALINQQDLSSLSGKKTSAGIARAIRAMLDDVDTLTSIAMENHDTNMVLLARYIKLRTLLDRGMWEDVPPALQKAEDQEECGLSPSLQFDSVEASTPKTAHRASVHDIQSRPDDAPASTNSPFADNTNIAQSQERQRTKAPEPKPACNIPSPSQHVPPRPGANPKLPIFIVPFHRIVVVHILILGIVYYTHIGETEKASIRLGVLHAVMDTMSSDTSGDGSVEIPLKSCPNETLLVQATHPKVLYCLTFLVTATAKRDAVGRRPKRKIFAEEGLKVLEREFDQSKTIEFKRWAGYGQVEEYEERMARIKADLMFEVIGVTILRSEFSLAQSLLDEIVTHLREHKLWNSSTKSSNLYSVRICLHHAHLAQAVGDTGRALQCYQVAAWIASGRDDAVDGGRVDSVMKDRFLYVAARAGEATLRLGMLRQRDRSIAASEEDALFSIEADAATMSEEDVNKFAKVVARECRGIGCALDSVGQVIEACLSTEIVKAKQHLKQALALCTKSQDNYMRAIVIALISSHYFHTQVQHACDMLGTANNLAAGLGAASIKGGSGGKDPVGHASLRLWIGERLLELYRRKMGDDETLIQKQELMVEKLRAAVKGISLGRASRSS